MEVGAEDYADALTVLEQREATLNQEVNNQKVVWTYMRFLDRCIHAFRFSDSDVIVYANLGWRDITDICTLYDRREWERFIGEISYQEDKCIRSVGDNQS